ncbi:MAG: hypothetical protein RIE59_02465 [Imperialibacter sp.]
MDIGIKKRNTVLTASLFVEKIVSVFLGKLLGIDHTEDSITLGNKASSFSFNQKVDLLIDIGALSGKEKAKFVHFMTIRNQFMHNWSADTYIRCVSEKTGLENYLIKTYPNDKKDREEMIGESITMLCNDVTKLAVGISEAVERKLAKENEAVIQQKSQEIFKEALDDVTSQLDKVIKSQLEKKAKISLQDYENIGSEVKRIIYSEWYRKLKRELGDAKNEVAPPEKV